MEFIYPKFLFALFALSIPIIIHLFNFRRYKTVQFSSIRYLRDVKEESRSRSTIKQWLILLSRLLALTAIILAFAQPFIPIAESQQKSGKTAVSIYLDNSLSMQATATEGQLIDLAKNKALSIIAAYRPSDRFQLITNDFMGKHQRWVNRETFVNYLQEVQISSKSRNFSQVVARQMDLQNESETDRHHFFVLSDLQKSSFDIDQIPSDSSTAYYLLPMQSLPTNNLYVDSCWLAAPYHQLDRQENLTVRIVNDGEKDRKDIPVRLMLNGQARTPATVSIAAGESAEVSLNYVNREGGWQKGTVEIKDYPVTFDDRYHLAYSITDSIRIIQLSGETPSGALKALFEHDDFFGFEQSDYRQLNYANFSKTQLIILDGLENIPSGLAQELQRFVQNQGSLAIFPPSEFDLDSYNRLLAALGVDQYLNKRSGDYQVNDLNLQSGLYRDVFEQLPEKLNLPKISDYHALSNNSSAGKQIIMRINNGDAFLNLYPLQGGKLYLSAVGLSETQSNWINHALFVPTLYNMALFSEYQQPLAFDMEEEQMTVRAEVEGDTPFHLLGEGIDLIPEQRNNNGSLRLNMHGEIKDAGFYSLQKEGEEELLMAFNYARNESELAIYETEEVMQMARAAGIQEVKSILEKSENLNRILEELNKGIVLWKYFIVLALLFLAIEILLIRMIK